MNNAAIQAEVASLRGLVIFKAAVELTRQENQLLRQKIDLLVERIFGSSSEQMDQSQLVLLLQMLPRLPKMTTNIKSTKSPPVNWAKTPLSKTAVA